MSSLLFVYKEEPFGSSRFNTLYSLAMAALEKGLKVDVFLDLEGVYCTAANQASYEVLTLTKDKFAELIEYGASVYICKICSGLRGLSHQDMHVEGAKPVDLEVLSLLMAEADRVISL